MLFAISLFLFHIDSHGADHTRFVVITLGALLCTLCRRTLFPLSPRRQRSFRLLEDDSPIITVIVNFFQDTIVTQGL